MISVALKAAKSAGRILEKYYQKNSPVSYKDTHNIVTEADIHAEKVILKTILNAFPHHSFFSEETGLRDVGSDYMWVIDPLDGTTNFVSKLPHFCVSIALFYKGKSKLGVVYNPITDELFVATKGGGVKLNGIAIHDSKVKVVAKALAVLDRGGSRAGKLHSVKLFDILTRHVRTVRIVGSTALDLCYAAAGRFDISVVFGTNLYDCAAGNLIASEAGALVTDFKGKPLGFDFKVKSILVANKALHPTFVKILRGARR